MSLLADGSEENSREVVSMSGGGGVPGAVSSEGLSGVGGSGSADMYDRVEALLPRVAALAADRARLEALNRTQRDLSGARENDLHARLLQAEASRTRWKKAYIDLPLLANPKIIELQEKDLEDSRNREALFDEDNSRPEIQLRGARRHVELSETNVGDEDIVRDLRAELTKFKQAYETLSKNKDKEAIEAAQKLHQNVEELQVAAQKKDDAIGKLSAEAADAKNKLRAMEKNYTTLLKMKEVEGAQATEAIYKLQKNIEELQVVARDKDDEICKLRAEALAAQKKLLVAEDDICKLKDGQLKSLKRKLASLSNVRVVDERRTAQFMKTVREALKEELQGFKAVAADPAEIQSLKEQLALAEKKAAEISELRASLKNPDSLSELATEQHQKLTKEYQRQLSALVAKERRLTDEVGRLEDVIAGYFPESQTTAEEAVQGYRYRQRQAAEGANVFEPAKWVMDVNDPGELADDDSAIATGQASPTATTRPKRDPKLPGWLAGHVLGRKKPV